MRSCDEFSSRAHQLLADHRQLHVMLQIARVALLHGGGPHRDATLVDVVVALRQIRDALAHHFSDEEASGCLDEMMSRYPRLSAHVERIRAEHRELLHDTDRLIAQGLDGEQTLKERIAISKAFDDLCEQFYAHEAAEDNLLRQAFAIDAGSEPHLPDAWPDRNGQPIEEASQDGKSHAQR
jgi:hemerythrin